ncbi:MAG: protein-L-isoaspartate(D-aspartate) O-methyltransferase [Gemmatimonadota bacterium]|nr:protein-L-isoaspartate(D-aspartate) O-methyltransferase [Gemmatimonadota bacterium]MDH5758771.1 protein-L-isoaspartate(D-aspartate) O-methyltransferase [Gemmatimonadota bacterium]
MDRMDEARDRARMVRRQLRSRGIEDERLLAMMAALPRATFLPPERVGEAYADHPSLIGHGQTISQPYMVAVMTQALRLTGGERVLEIGTGSGYQTAVLAGLVETVYSIERIPDLAREATARLRALGIRNVTVAVRDGSLGWPERAPFDAIMVTAGAPAIPPSLLHQLSPIGGRLVVPVGNQDIQNLVLVVRWADEFRSREFTPCHFVPLLGAEAWSTA